MINQLKLIGLPFAISSFLYVAPNSVGCPADAFEGDDNEYVTPGKPPAEASGMEGEPPPSHVLTSLGLNEEGGNGGNSPVSDQTTDLDQEGWGRGWVTSSPEREDGGGDTVTTLAVNEEGGDDSRAGVPTSEVGGEEGGDGFDVPVTSLGLEEEGGNGGNPPVSDPTTEMGGEEGGGDFHAPLTSLALGEEG